MKLHRLSLLGAAVVVGLTGCGGGNGNEQSGSSSSGSSSVVKTVTISETEYKLTPSSVSLPRTGKYEFKVVNKGSTTHALEIEGNGLDDQKSSEVAPGESTTLDVTFDKEGSYEMYCPVDGHKGLGMKGDLTVGSAGGGGGGTTTNEMDTETNGGGGY
jgi:uncharacterized cupredoxin-like copper-binding protein